jgi:hypothetical protein
LADGDYGGEAFAQHTDYVAPAKAEIWIE